MTVKSGNQPYRGLSVVLLVCCLALISVGAALFRRPHENNARFRVVLGKAWRLSDQLPITKIDHHAWDQLLKQYVDDFGDVDYSAWRNSQTDVSRLDDYLTSLSKANPDLDADRETRLAFWINAYNALTIQGILTQDRSSSRETRDQHSSEFDFWRDLVLMVGGREYSLDQIENDVLRPLKEPRIHFAIVCGARGCPRLLNGAYDGADLEKQLHANSRHFFADPTKLKFDATTGQLQLSPILRWYGKDFGETDSELLHAIRPYLPVDVVRQITTEHGIKPGFLEYDSNRNEQEVSGPPIPVTEFSVADPKLREQESEP